MTLSGYYLLLLVSMRMPMPQLVHTSTNVAFSAFACHFMYAYANACAVHPNDMFCCLLAFSSSLDAWKPLPNKLYLLFCNQLDIGEFANLLLQWSTITEGTLKATRT